MAYIRPNIYRAMKENEVDSIVFQDPFTEETRKKKRNFLAASFACLLITILQLKVTGFLGLQASTGDLGTELASGLAATIVVYFFINFILFAYIDYMAWKHKREKLLIKPYLEFLKMLESHVHVTGEQIKNAMNGLSGIVIESGMQSEVEFSKIINNASGQLSSIEKHQRELMEEMRPLIEHWKKTILGTKRLTWRLRARFFSLWVLDIILPVSLGIIALGNASSGLQELAIRVGF